MLLEDTKTIGNITFHLLSGQTDPSRYITFFEYRNGNHLYKDVIPPIYNTTEEDTRATHNKLLHSLYISIL